MSTDPGSVLVVDYITKTVSPIDGFLIGITRARTVGTSSVVRSRLCVWDISTAAPDVDVVAVV